MSVDLKTLSPAALGAAMRGGTEAWGKHASIMEHVGYVEPQTARRGHYLKCRCGCGGKENIAPCSTVSAWEKGANYQCAVSLKPQGQAHDHRQHRREGTGAVSKKAGRD